MLQIWSTLVPVVSLESMKSWEARRFASSFDIHPFIVGVVVILAGGSKVVIGMCDSVTTIMGSDFNKYGSVRTMVRAVDGQSTGVKR